jgi:hypothetical protein
MAPGDGLPCCVHPLNLFSQCSPALPFVACAFASYTASLMEASLFQTPLLVVIMQKERKANTYST